MALLPMAEKMMSVDSKAVLIILYCDVLWFPGKQSKEQVTPGITTVQNAC